MAPRRLNKAKARAVAEKLRRARGLGGRALGILLRCLRLGREQFRGKKLLKRGKVWYVPLWQPVAIALLLASSALWDDAARLAQKTAAALRGEVALAEFFAPSVRHWEREILQWAALYEVDPHLLATVMQIESCGHPTVISGAGARGLFQVMPYHFEAGENMLDPATNAKRGGGYLRQCYQAADGLIGLTLACYNGGQGALRQPRDRWPSETQRYYRWGLGVYGDAAAGASSSQTLDQWLSAGGQRLCDSARQELGG